MGTDKHYREPCVVARTAFFISLLIIGSVVIFPFIGILGLGFISFFLVLILSPVAFFLGVISIPIIIFRRRKLTSLIYSLLAILVSLPVVLFFGLFLISPTREDIREAELAIENNMEVLSNELIIYSQNHDGYLPSADNWCDALLDQNPELDADRFIHPWFTNDRLEFYIWRISLRQKGQCQIAFNSLLSDQLVTEVFPETILLFEADGPWNLHGTDSLLNSGPGILRRRKQILFMDGSIVTYGFLRSTKNSSNPKYKKIRWEP